MISNDNNMDLWKEYAVSKESMIREKLIVEYSYIVKFVAGRLSVYFGQNVEYDDLIGYGILGLIDAIDKFDVTKGVKFETYASLRIRGAIIDSIRNLDWVPRSLRQKSKAIERAYWELENELGHSATDKQVADKMGISLEKFNKLVRDVNLSTILSLDEVLEQNFDATMNGSSINKEEKPEGYLEIVEVRTLLAREISAIMEVSESRVSQLHTKAISRLGVKLAKDRKVLMN